MKIKNQTINCPNCGSHGEKIHYLERKIIEISCPKCDYLLVKSADGYKVVEAFAPGLTGNF